MEIPKWGVPISPVVARTTPNAMAAHQFWEWIREQPFDKAMAGYQAMHKNKDVDDDFLRTLAQLDRYYLAVFICERHDMINPWLYERCREVQYETDERLDLWARFHYKSTIVTQFGSIQEIIKNPNITIGIFSYSTKQAKPFLRAIMQNLETNKTLIKLFPDILYEKPKTQSHKWSENEGVRVKRTRNSPEETIQAFGLTDGQPTGYHFQLQIYDDVVVRSSVTTPEQIKNTTEQWELSLNLGDTHNPRRQYVGTRYSYGDTYGTIMQRAAVIPRIFPATHNGKMDGNPVFLSNERWEEIVKTTSQYTIACQQLLNPLEGTDVSFKEEWWREYEIRPYTMNVYITVDPANSKKKGSNRTAISVIGVDHAFNKYLLDGLCHKMSLSERWDNLKKVRERWLRMPGVREVKVGYERYGAQSDIEHFREMMKIEGRSFPIYEVAWVGGDNQGQSKTDRVQRLEPDLRNGSFFFPHPTDPKNLTSLQRSMVASGQSFMLSRKIVNIDEEGKTYDMCKWLKENEYDLFPSIHPDFLDAMSRIYDMDMRPPRFTSGQTEPAAEPAY